MKVKIETCGSSKMIVPEGMFRRGNGITFECKKCGAIFELDDTFDNLVDCPECGGKRCARRQD